jgi:hypothetical protein
MLVTLSAAVGKIYRFRGRFRGPGEANGGFLQHLYLAPEPHSLALFFAPRQRGPRLSQLRILSTQLPGNPMQPIAQLIDEVQPLPARRHRME